MLRSAPSLRHFASSCTRTIVIGNPLDVVCGRRPHTRFLWIFPHFTPGVHLSAHPAFHQTDLLSSFRFQCYCTLTGTAHSQISRFEFFSIFHNFAHRLCVQLRRYGAVMNHAVARFAKPCQIGDFIDSLDWKLIVDVVTVLWNCRGE